MFIGKYLLFVYLVILNSLAFGQGKVSIKNTLEVDYRKIERRDFIRNFSSHIIEDKKKLIYNKVLQDVTPYPNLQFNIPAENYLIEFDKYILGLLPYMLTKLKNKDLNGEFHIFFKALQLAGDMESHLPLTLMQETSYKFLLQAMQTEKSLRACSQMISKYQEKAPQIDIQLSRMDNEMKASAVPGLNKLKQDLYFLNSSLIGQLQDTKLNN